MKDLGHELAILVACSRNTDLKSSNTPLTHDSQSHEAPFQALTAMTAPKKECDGASRFLAQPCGLPARPGAPLGSVVARAVTLRRSGERAWLSRSPSPPAQER
jgi:hypothetical protein